MKELLDIKRTGRENATGSEVLGHTRPFIHEKERNAEGPQREDIQILQCASMFVNVLL
jgi:hypothetical protein